MLNFNVLGKFYIENEQVFVLYSHAYRFVSVEGESWDTESVSTYEEYFFLDEKFEKCGQHRTRNAGTGGGQWEEITDFEVTANPKYLYHTWRRENGFHVDTGEGIYVLTDLRPEALALQKEAERRKGESDGEAFRKKCESENKKSIQKLRARRAAKKHQIA